jgi:hypothetical protein
MIDLIVYGLFDWLMPKLEKKLIMYEQVKEGEEGEDRK